MGVEGGVLTVLNVAGRAHEDAAGGAVERGGLRRCSFNLLVHRTHVVYPCTFGNRLKVLDHVVRYSILRAAEKLACWAVHGRASGDRGSHAVPTHRVETIKELGVCDGPLAATASLWLWHGTRAGQVKKRVKRHRRMRSRRVLRWEQSGLHGGRRE